MLCCICGSRFAPFSKDDFEFIPGKGFYPKHDMAEYNRGVIFDNDFIGEEACCKGLAEIDTNYLIIITNDGIRG